MSRNRQLFLAGAVLLAFILQVAVMPQFKLFGVQPDLILVVAVVVAVQEGPVEGAIVGFCGGMMMDIVSPQVMGV
ncbi:MAG: rod shape-determining protein MreD, partial [Actinobacteria bacterium]|nr:rod shape-determining protein MreD [Actinomycetota bacterium]